jgi:hypothetical protein
MMSYLNEITLEQLNDKIIKWIKEHLNSLTECQRQGRRTMIPKRHTKRNYLQT